MPRVVTSTIQALLDSGYGETHDILDLTLPLQVGETEADRIELHVSKVSGITYGGNEYLPTLRSVGTIKFSLGKASDNAEVTIENVSKTLGITLSDDSRILDGSRAVLTRLFVTSDGLEGLVLFVGYVRDVKVNQTEITMSLISDMSRRTSPVASRQISQRCIWTFRGPECDWTTDQPGSPTFCSKVFDDATDGCLAHDNQVRFGGVPTLSPKAQEIVGTNGGGILGNGWDNPDGNPIIDRPWRFGPFAPFNSP